MSLAYVGMGSNLGDPRHELEQAFGELARLPRTRLARRSSFYRSAPLGYTAQPEFLNAVAELDTVLAPEALLEALQAIEARHKRARSFRYAPRTLDLDLLLYDDAELADERLRVPHPRMHERAFVLRPLVELAPDIAIPGRGPAARLLAACAGQRVEMDTG